MNAVLSNDPHAAQPVIRSGPTPEVAGRAIVLIHGRGASAESMLPLLDELEAEQFAAVAPQAAGRSWYPNSFLAPMESNQPYLDSALAKIESVIADLIASGIPSERIVLLGFSQGACLTLESVARHPLRENRIRYILKWHNRTGQGGLEYEVH